MSTEFKKKYFKTNILIKNIIGKELINDDNVAVMELVKNSYDAGASKVIIEFKNIFSKNKNSELIIQDDGCGMSEDDILDKWLNIAYSSKKSEHTQNNRYQAGNKGIGRFSCDRLGRELNIYTKIKSSKNYLHLKINWKDFELFNEIDTQIQDVPVYIREIELQEFKNESGFELFEQGTILHIKSLNSYWLDIESKSSLFKEFEFDKTKLLKLKLSLERLINPNQQYNQNSFKIYIKVPELDENKELAYHQRITGEIKNQIFDKLNFQTTSIESFITEDGLKIVTELKDKNKTIFKIIEKNEEFSLLKGVKIVIYYLNPYAKGFFTKQTGIQPVEFGSIFLFINGFRIPPYGDRENDTLGLDARKTQGYSRYFGNREILGRIEIQDFSNNFRVVSSREGIVQNEYYKQLIRDSEKSNKKYNGFFYNTLIRLEKYVVDGLKWDSLPDDMEEATIQKEIVDGTWNGKEIYKIDNNEKIVNTSALIKQILSVKPKNIIDLYINEELVENLIEEDKEKTQKKLEDFIKNFGSISIDKFDEKTQKALKKLTGNIEDETLVKLYQDTLSKKEQLEEKLEEEKKTKKELYNLYKKQKRESKKLLKQKEQSEKQANKLKKIISKDVKELVAFQHHIGLYANTAKDYILDTLRDVKNEQFDKNNYLENLQVVVLELEKIKVISKYITRENYLSAEKKVNDDLVQFILNYTKNIYETTTNREFFININTNNIEYICKFEPIKINIIIDNLLSNSKKDEINARNITINFFKDKDTLLMEYVDDGKGLNSSIVDPDSIFDIGVSTTKGSGLGMYHIKELLSKMKSTVSVEIQKQGIKFLIRFNL